MRYDIAMLLSLLIVAPIAAFAGVNVGDLEANPLWMPGRTSVKGDLVFSSGEKVVAGREYVVHSLEGDVLRLWFPHGKGTFSVAVSDSNLLEDAEEHLAELKPEQRELSPKVIAGRPGIWPLEVEMERAISYGNGVSLRKGGKYTVTKFDGGQLEIFDGRRNMLFNVSPADTDFFDLCLQNVLTDQPSRLYRELSRHVLDAGTLKPAEDFLKDGGPEYIAIYYAAGWCPYCEQTSPEVMKWYKENQAREERNIEMVVVSRDKSRRELQNHISKLGFESWVVSYQDVQPMIILRNTPDSGGLPYLFVVNRDGEVVLQSSGEMPMDRTQDMLDRMRTLQAKLDSQSDALATDDRK